MTTATFLDTSYFLALVNSGDKYHQAAVDAARQIKPPYVTSEAVLLELGNALSRPPARALANAALTAIRHDRAITIVPMSSDIFAAAVDLFQNRPDKAWGLTDCTSFIIMQQLDLTAVLTADRHFAQAGFTRLLPEL